MTDAHTRSLLRFALVTSALTLPAPAAWAQSTAGDGDSDIVVTAQRENQTQVIRGGQLGILGDKPSEDVPFSIKGYSETLILNQQSQTLGQVLENDPSVRTTYGFGNAAEQFVIRGFTLYGDDVGFNGLYGLTPRQLVAPELYQQVQVLNGASAFLNGAAPSGSGVGGSVNLISKRAGDRPLTRLTANYSSSSHFGGAFDVARRFGDGAFGIRINGAARSGDVAIEDEFRSAYVLGGALDWRGTRARLSLDLGYQRARVRNLRPKVTIGTATIPAVPDADANYGQAFSYTTLRDVFGMVHGEYDLADNALLYASFGARDGMEKGIYDTITVNNAMTGEATGNALFVPRTDNNEAAQAGLRVKLAAGGITHEFNLGGSALWQVNRNAYDFLYGPGFAGFATNLYATPDVALPSSSLVGGDLDDPFPISRTRLASAFASDTIGAFDDRVLLTAGLRLQTIRTSGYAANADASLGIAAGERTSLYDEDAVTLVVGLVVKPVAGLSLFANRIEGLSQGPSAPTTDANVLNPGQVFAPFKSTQYEVGGKLALGRFNASLAVYQTELPSAYAVATPTAANANATTYGIYGKQRNRGIELSLDGEPVDGLRIIAGGSINEAKLRDMAGGLNEGNDAVGVPEYLANANVEWDLPFVRGATLTGRVVRTGEQAVNPSNTLALPAWTRFDLGARYVAVVADRPLTLRFTVDNVADKRYWASSYDSFGTALLQGAPRTFKLSASVDL